MTLSLLTLVAALADGPVAPFPDCGPDQRDACPSDLDDWQLVSWIPDGSAASVRDAEIAIGSGIALDEALRLGAGSWGVTVAVLDSGVRWTSSEVSATTWLNAAELPLPLDATGAPNPDPNGDGRLSVADFIDDPRVRIDDGVEPADDRLDPSDLIAAFSDGVDDDGNGWVDDIAGWDFFEDDNDPFAVTGGAAGDHGTGVMSAIAADGDDGGSIGVCPNCSILPIRVGDSFISNGDRVGPAVRYATEIGARVIAMAVGGLSHPAHVDDALWAADAAGVVLVGAAGDENSYHRNRPAAADPVLFVHSIRGNNLIESSNTKSYLAIWNCNNWGPRLDLVAPAAACATGAVASTAGAAGLLLGVGDAHGVSLSPGQIRALLTSTATDVDVSPAEQDAIGLHPSHAGWDPFYGHGRLHVGRALREALAAPHPEATVLSPRWGAWVDEPMAIVAHVDHAAAWDLSWGVGVDPTEWTPLASGTGSVSGEIAVFDPADVMPVQGRDLLVDDTVADRLARAHEPLVTLRLTADGSDGRRAVTRRGVWVNPDPDALPGFPLDLSDSLEAATALADLTGDGVFEIVVATSGGRVEALRGDGTPVPGFPVHTDPMPFAERAPWRDGVELPRDGVVAAPAVGDVDGDGRPDVVVATLGGAVHAWSADGDALPGFPVYTIGRPVEERLEGDTWEDGVFAAPSLGDVDGDGALEIVVAAMDRRLYAWSGDGTLRPGFPLDLCGDCAGPGDRIIGGPALGDVDGDGDLDAIVGTGESPPGTGGFLFAVDLTDAAIWPGWPLERPGISGLDLLPFLGEGHPSSAALADLDDDGDLEIWSFAILGTVGPIHHDGSEAVEIGFGRGDYAHSNNVDELALVTLATNPAFGDLDGDGVDDLAVGTSGVGWPLSLASAAPLQFQHAVGAWSGADGTMLPAWPRQIDDTAFLTAPAIADVSGDGRPEVLATSGGHFVGAWDATGASAPGWPKFTGGWSTGGPSVGDIDGDGFLDVVIGTRAGHLFAWRSAGRADQAVQWASARHDPANTGSRATPLPTQAGPNADPLEVLPPDEGAGCCSGGRASGLLVWPVLLLAWRRRR
ncbi:MAG: hypothetical protein ACI8PZ_002660 [Myxococcota bacterium]|jgi:hypothetical protein